MRDIADVGCDDHAIQQGGCLDLISIGSKQVQQIKLLVSTVHQLLDVDKSMAIQLEEKLKDLSVCIDRFIKSNNNNSVNIVNELSQYMTSNRLSHSDNMINFYIKQVHTFITVAKLEHNQSYD